MCGDFPTKRWGSSNCYFQLWWIETRRMLTQNLQKGKIHKLHWTILQACGQEPAAGGHREGVDAGPEHDGGHLRTVGGEHQETVVSSDQHIVPSGDCLDTRTRDHLSIRLYCGKRDNLEFKYLVPLQPLSYLLTSYRLPSLSNACLVPKLAVSKLPVQRLPPSSETCPRL